MSARQKPVDTFRFREYNKGQNYIGKGKKAGVFLALAIGARMEGARNVSAFCL